MEIEKYKDLPDKLYKQFDKLSDEAYELFQQKRYNASFQKYEECLSLFPEPKEDYGDYSNAKKWVDKLGTVFKNQEILGDWDFLKGKVYFHCGDFKVAWESFNNAYKKTGMDCFIEQAHQYIDFYKNPQKYVGNE